MQVLNVPIPEIVDRLAAHKMLGNSPREELEWLATHGELRAYNAGDVVVLKTERVTDMVVMLSGHASIHVDRGTGRRKVMEWSAGDVAGNLPYSRVGNPPGDSMIEEDTEAVALHCDLF